MNNQADIQHNKLIKLDNTMLMYGIYNAETLEKLINTVQDIHNVTSSHEKLFAGEHNPTIFRLLYMDALGTQQYAFNSLLFLRVIQDKYISLIQGINHPIEIICLSYQGTCKRLFTHHSDNTKQTTRNFGRGQEIITAYQSRLCLSFRQTTFVL